MRNEFVPTVRVMANNMRQRPFRFRCNSFVSSSKGNPLVYISFETVISYVIFFYFLLWFYLFHSFLIYQVIVSMTFSVKEH